MDSKQSNEYEILNSEIDELEEDVQRLALSNEISYDENFHQTVVKKYRALITEIKDSSISDEDKNILYSLIKEVFQENLIID